MLLPRGNTLFRAHYFVCEFRMDVSSPHASLYINLQSDFPAALSPSPNSMTLLPLSLFYPE